MSQADDDFFLLYDECDDRPQAWRELANAANPFVRCPYCGAGTRRRDSSVVYGGNWTDRELVVCTRFPVCDAYVGCYDDGTPLGTLANKQLRAARMAAHTAFDPIWKGGELTRAKAYAWLARALGTRPDETHIGMFQVAQCEAVVQACTARQFGGGVQ